MLPSRHSMSQSGLKIWDPMWSGKSQLPSSRWLRLHGLTSSDLGLGSRYMERSRKERCRVKQSWAWQLQTQEMPPWFVQRWQFGSCFKTNPTKYSSHMRQRRDWKNLNYFGGPLSYLKFWSLDATSKDSLKWTHHSKYTKYDIWYHVIFYVTMVSFHMIFLMNKFTNLSCMIDESIHWLKPTLSCQHSPTLGAHIHAHPCPWVFSGHGVRYYCSWVGMDGHGCNVVVHGWAWVRYYCSWVSMGQSKAYWKGSLNEFLVNAFEGKSTGSPSPNMLSPSFSVYSFCSPPLSSWVCPWAPNNPWSFFCHFLALMFFPPYSIPNHAKRIPKLNGWSGGCMKKMRSLQWWA